MQFFTTNFCNDLYRPSFLKEKFAPFTTPSWFIYEKMSRARRSFSYKNVLEIVGQYMDAAVPAHTTYHPTKITPWKKQLFFLHLIISLFNRNVELYTTTHETNNFGVENTKFHYENSTVPLAIFNWLWRVLLHAGNVILSIFEWIFSLRYYAGKRKNVVYGRSQAVIAVNLACTGNLA